MVDLNSTIDRGKLRVTEDINANGNVTGSSITGNGSGLTNLNASNVSSGTLSADRLATSGVTAGSYGPSANATPAYGATFNVPYITVDNKGRVTKAETKTVKIPASDNTDTKNTAGAMDDAGKLYLVGAKSQGENNQTYSNSNVYMTNGTLAASALSTSVIESQSANLNIKVSNNGIKNAASFGYYSLGGAILSFDGHLKINDGGSYSGKPTNQTT